MEGLVISKDAVGKNQLELIPYKVIKCVNPLGRNSFFFKSNNKGYALFFSGQEAGNSMKWFEALIVLIDKDVNTKEQTKIFDLTELYSQFDLQKQECEYKYTYTNQLRIDNLNREKKRSNQI